MTRKVLMIATDWNDGTRHGRLGGVTYYRLQVPKRYLESLGYEVDLFGKDFAQHVYKDVRNKNDVEELKSAYRDFIFQYDLVISKVIDNKIAGALLIESCKRTKTPLVIDIDDNFLAVTADQPAYRKGYAPGGEPRANACAFVSMADAIFASTQPLADYYTNFITSRWGSCPPAFVLENSYCAEDWKDKTKTNKVIGWAGSITHDQDLRMVLPALYNILKKYDDYTVELVGGFTKDNFKDKYNPPTWFWDRVKFQNGTLGWDGYTDLLANLDWRLGLAPIIDNDFNQSKSHIKWQEYALVGIPCVASDVYPYKKKIKHGKTGFLARSDEWYEKMDEALQSELDTIVNETKLAVDDLEISKQGQKWEKAIDSVV